MNDNGKALLDKLTQNKHNAFNILKDYIKKHKDSCPFHPNADHDLIDCFTLKWICKQSNTSEDLDKLRRDLKRNSQTISIGSNARQNNSNQDAGQNQGSRNSTATQRARRAANQFETLVEEYPLEVDDEASEEEAQDVEDNSTSNSNNNDDVNSYLCSITPHNSPSECTTILGRSRASKSTCNRTSLPPKLFQFIIDSSATATMCPSEELFESITYFDTSNCLVVEMGDKKTRVQVLGQGYINLKLHNKTICLFALYIPDMGNTSLISILQHISHQGCYFHSEDKETILAYPTFLIHPAINDKIEVIASLPSSNATPHFDKSTSTPTRPHQQQSITDVTLNMVPQSMIAFVDNSTTLDNLSSSVHLQKILPSTILPTQTNNQANVVQITSPQQVLLPPNESTTIGLGMLINTPQNIAARFTLDEHLQKLGAIMQSQPILT